MIQSKDDIQDRKWWLIYYINRARPIFEMSEKEFFSFV